MRKHSILSYGRLQGGAGLTLLTNIEILGYVFYREAMVQININSIGSYESIVGLVPSSQGRLFSIRISSYQYMNSHYEDETVSQLSPRYNMKPSTGKPALLYWFGPQGVMTVSLYPDLYVPMIIARCRRSVHSIMSFPSDWRCATKYPGNECPWRSIYSEVISNERRTDLTTMNVNVKIHLFITRERS